MLTDPKGRKLPTGVTYDPTRRRYRVRLYHGEQPVWLSYARVYTGAMEQYRQARTRQQFARANTQPIGGIRACIRTLRQRLL